MLAWLTIAIGLLGLILLIVHFGDDFLEVWINSGQGAAVIVTLLSLNGPMLMVMKAFKHPTYVGQLLLLINAFYILTTLLTLFLARSQDHSLKQWGLASVLVPFVPGIILAVLYIREQRRYMPLPRHRRVLYNSSQSSPRRSLYITTERVKRTIGRLHRFKAIQFHK